MLGDIRSGTIGTVITWHPDRLTRRTRELEDLIDTLDAAKVAVLTVTAGSWDLSSPSGRTTAKIIGAVAQQEGELKAQRIKAKSRQLSEQGYATKAKERLYGYTHDVMPQVIEDEAAHIRDVAQRVIEGETLGSLCKLLNDRGARTTRGNEWTRATLRSVLLNPAGCQAHHGGQGLPRRVAPDPVGRGCRGRGHHPERT